MIEHFAEHERDTGRVTQCLSLEHPIEGNPFDPAFEYLPMAAAIDWSGQGSPTEELRVIDGTLAWIETATLEASKERKRAEITAARMLADAGHFIYQGVKIRTAEKDMFDLLVTNARIQMGDGMPPNWVGGWLGIDGIVPISTREEWKTFFVSMYDAGIANFMYSQQLKAEIENATTPAQIEAITW